MCSRPHLAVPHESSGHAPAFDSERPASSCGARPSLRSGRRESNSVYLLPKQTYYRYTTARHCLNIPAISVRAGENRTPTTRPPALRTTTILRPDARPRIARSTIPDEQMISIKTRPGTKSRIAHQSHLCGDTAPKPHRKDFWYDIRLKAHQQS